MLSEKGTHQGRMIINEREWKIRESLSAIRAEREELACLLERTSRELEGLRENFGRTERLSRTNSDSATLQNELRERDIKVSRLAEIRR